MIQPLASTVRAAPAERRRSPHSARQGASRTVLLGLVVLLLGFVLAGCQAAASGDTPSAASGRSSTAVAAGQVALAVPVELRQVLAMSPCAAGKSTVGNPAPATVSVTPATPATVANSAAIAESLAPSSVVAPPTTLHDVDGVDCYQVSAPLLVLQQLNAINISSQPPASRWVITMTMTPSDAQSLTAVTQDHPGQQFAFVVRDTVLSAQSIPQPITNGIVQIAGNFTQDDANRLMRQITG